MTETFFTKDILHFKSNINRVGPTKESVLQNRIACGARRGRHAGLICVS